MLWSLKYQSKVSYYQKREAKGYNTPLSTQPAFDNEVNIYTGYFFKLNHFRQQVMSGVGNLQLNDIVLCHTLEPYGNVNEFIRIIIATDSTYIKFYGEKK